MTGKIKHITILLLSISTITCLCDAHGVRKDKETLIADARDIIYGTVENIEYIQYEGYPHWMTKVTMRVIDQYKGETSEKIVVQFEGGEFYSVAFNPGTVKKGDEAIVFTFKTEFGYLTILEAKQGYLLVKDDEIDGYEMTLEQFRDYVNEVMASDRARKFAQRELNRRQCAVYESKDVVLGKVVHIGDAEYVGKYVYTPVTLNVIERFKGDPEERELTILVLGGDTKTTSQSGILYSFDIDSEVIAHTVAGPEGYLYAPKHALYVTDSSIPQYDMTLSQFRDFVKRELSRDWAVEYAEDILYGKVSNKYTEEHDKGGVVTYVNFKVLERFKGDSSEREIVLFFPGESEERYPPLKPYIIGAELIVYVKMLSTYGCLGTTQGPFTVINDTIPELDMSLAEYREFVRQELSKCLNE